MNKQIYHCAVLCCSELVLCEEVLYQSQEQLAPVEETVSGLVQRL